MDAAAGAQCVIFGIGGIRVEPPGREIVINPHPPKFSPEVSLKGVNIRGTHFDVIANRNDYEVRVGSKTLRSKVGTPVVIAASA
jgi:hypothetical protein